MHYAAYPALAVAEYATVNAKSHSGHEYVEVRVMNARYGVVIAAGLIATMAMRPVGATDTAWNAGTADYNVGANWTPSSVPDFTLDGRGVVNNGGAPFLISASASNP